MATTAKAARPATSTKKAEGSKTAHASPRKPEGVAAKDGARKSAPRVVKAEPFEREVVERLREEVLGSVRRKAPHERRLGGLLRALAPHSPLARGVLAEAGE